MTRIDLWNEFCSTGAIKDYLSYRNECARQEEKERAGSDKGNRDPLKKHG